MHKSLMSAVFTLAVTACSHATSGDPIQEDALHIAAARNDVAQIERLLSHQIQIDARDASGATALMVATRANNVYAAQFLIDAGADVNAKDQIQDSPYLYAGARGYLKILSMTLTHGADLKSTNRYGGTALIPAAERGHVDTVRTLIAAGVDVDHINNLGWTALLEAIILGNGSKPYQQIVDLLIKAGADVNIADGDGITPLEHAHARGYISIEKALLDAGAKKKFKEY
ncbi:hypothetical protein F909_01432 [Acinetobacter sp. ANC 3929]|uniref:ankyrin repeat domain-containing protein n=1 Tax=unclassified Acinetobacter TaxID=196816 RepID=UPI0002CEE950|nr:MULTISPECIES: ankyrin repeat domain-containing protein [unclassified Acinetobacter]ENW81748.1 hypothetical protein F909_01432 [Acinetobacter sp. ANC 3929]MCH7357523.1 ankyrin repeat domain-containing protein [Acinetobacter sp. NIPH 1958]